MIAKRITTMYDARLMGVWAVAFTNDLPAEIMSKYAWVRGYAATSKTDLIIERSRFEMPISKKDFDLLGGNTIDGLDPERSAEEVAKSCGWSLDQLKDMCGVSEFVGYPGMIVPVVVGINSEDYDRTHFSWRSFVAAVERIET